MIMVRANQWSEIKKSWKKACRMLGPECDTQLESVDKALLAIDELMKKFGAAPLPPL